MDTNLLYEKLNRFEKAVQDNKYDKAFIYEVLNDIREWFITIEKYISELEMEKYEDSLQLQIRDKRVKNLIMLIIISGNLDLLTAADLLEPERLEKTLDFLMDAKEERNYKNIFAISKLLELVESEGKEPKSIKELLQYAGTLN